MSVTAPRGAALQGAASTARPVLRLGPGAALPLGRAHEVCGPGRVVFAAMAAGRAGAVEDGAGRAGAGRAGAGFGGAGRGPVLWIRGPAAEGRLEPDGLAAFFDPARLVLAAPERMPDVTWCAEEALRAGAAVLVVVELAGPLGLTAVRRLHIAAEAGTGPAAARGAPAPLALLLTPGEGGSAGVETRWSLAFAPSGGGASPADEVRDGAPPPRLAPRRREAGDVGAAAVAGLAGEAGAIDEAGQGVGEAAAGGVAGAGVGDECRGPHRPTLGAGAVMRAGVPGIASKGVQESTSEVTRTSAASSSEWPVAVAIGVAGDPGAASPVAPWPCGGSPIWRLDLLRARLMPSRQWRVRWSPGAADGPLHVADPTAVQPHSEPEPRAPRST